MGWGWMVAFGTTQLKPRDDDDDDHYYHSSSYSYIL